MTWVVAGLGNPEERYRTTRHNAGAMVAELLAERAGERFRKVRFVPVDVAETRLGGERVLLARSHRFMNESGPSFASLARKNDVLPEQVIAVHDEIDLPFGALRIKHGGSTAGHNGLNSLVSALKSDEFLRVRVGVGRPPGRGDPIGYVLRPFSKDQQPDVPLLLDDAADAVVSLVENGLERTQDRFNRSGPRS
ncbi:MAG: aminoacyl-tRNA hydrolase [Actinomycetota bacterium]|nr:aminoacyl-tRNA hydrolase [Actinomycetota bacterium]